MKNKVTATQWLRDEHKKLIGVMRQCQALAAKDAREEDLWESSAREFLDLLEIHSRIEQELFYPSLMAFEEGRPKAEGAIDDHRALDDRVLFARQSVKQASDWEVRLDEIFGLVEEHLSEEERTLLPLAERLLGEKSQELRSELEERKRQLIKLPEFAAAAEAMSRAMNGGEQLRKNSIAA